MKTDNAGAQAVLPAGLGKERTRNDRLRGLLDDIQQE